MDIQEYLTRAEIWAERAAQATNPIVRAACVAMEQSYRGLADTITRIEARQDERRPPSP